MPGMALRLPRSVAFIPAFATECAVMMGIHGPSNNGIAAIPARSKKRLRVGPGQSVVTVTPVPRSSQDSAV